MNKERRTKIQKIIEEITITKDKLQDVLDEEEYAFDNMPENLQNSARGEESQDAIDSMEEVIDNLDDAIDTLENLL